MSSLQFLYNLVFITTLNLLLLFHSKFRQKKNSYKKWSNFPFTIFSHKSSDQTFFSLRYRLHPAEVMALPSTVCSAIQYVLLLKTSHSLWPTELAPNGIRDNNYFTQHFPVFTDSMLTDTSWNLSKGHVCLFVQSRIHVGGSGRWRWSVWFHSFSPRSYTERMHANPSDHFTRLSPVWNVIRPDRGS